MTARIARLWPGALLLAGCSADSPDSAGVEAGSREPPGSDATTALLAPSMLATPAQASSGEAHLALDTEGRAILSWLEPAADAGNALKFSRFDGADWSDPHTIAVRDDFVVNWADFPSVQPITAQTWIAHWLQSAPDSLGAYDVAYALSDDGGETWSQGRLLNDDGTLSEHGFVTLFPWDDAIGAVWLDGRRLAEVFDSGDFDPEGPPVGTSLRYARIGFDGEVAERGELDELTCDCCQTDVALTDAGPVAVYRDRTADEMRDNVVLRFTAGAWQQGPTLGPDHWQISGCPVNGPAVAARGSTVVAAWFTAPDDMPQTRFAISTDAGASFSAPLQVDGEGSFGHVDVVLLEDGDAVVSWWRRGSDGGTALTARVIDEGGAPAAAQVIAENATPQPLDVPQMVATPDGLVFAWTDAAEQTVRTAIVRTADR